MHQNPFNARVVPSGGRFDIWHAPDGWPHRRFRMGPVDGGGARGQMLFVAGRGDMAEKYFEVMSGWAAQGWAVTTFDWRGQGGSGRLAADPMVGHISDFAQWIADLRAFAADWTAQAPGPHVMIGHSMGGHMLLRALVEGAVAPDAAVLTAPMFGLNGGAIPGWLARIIVAVMRRVAGPAGAAWTQNEQSAVRLRLRQMRLTHSDTRHEDELWWRRTHPAIALGPPSWDWLRAAYRSTADVAHDPALDRMAAPVLILGTSADQLVSPAAIERIAARLPDAALHMYGAEAAHEILREADGVRIDALARIDAFLDARAPGR